MTLMATVCMSCRCVVPSLSSSAVALPTSALLVFDLPLPMALLYMVCQLVPFHGLPVTIEQAKFCPCHSGSMQT